MSFWLAALPVHRRLLRNARNSTQKFQGLVEFAILQYDHTRGQRVSCTFIWRDGFAGGVKTLPRKQLEFKVAVLPVAGVHSSELWKSVWETRAEFA